MVEEGMVEVDSAVAVASIERNNEYISACGISHHCGQHEIAA